MESGARYCEVREFRFLPRGTIRVTVAPTGGTHIRAWDRDSVLVQARLEARAASDREARAVVEGLCVEAAASGVRAHDCRGRSSDMWLVTFNIYVPRHSDLDVSVNNGPLMVEGVQGKMTLDQANGPLVLVGLAGAVHARTQLGPLSVTLAGTTWEGGGLDAETLSGPVTVDIPKRYSARLDLESLSGPVEVDYPGVTPAPNELRVMRTLGTGGARIRIVSRGGPASLRQVDR